jgi:Fe-S cluster assembly protein SufB
MSKEASTETLEDYTKSDYKYGFTSNIDTDLIPKGLNEDTIRLISFKKEEPQWLLDWRLEAFRHWETLTEPKWPNVKYPPVNYQDIIYYAAPKQKKTINSLDEVDPELLRTYEKLGISIEEQKRLTGVAMDIVIDSVSVATTFKEQLSELGIIFCSFGEAVQEHPELIRKYMGSVVPSSDNFFATLNSAVFTDGSFCYIPKGVRCPMELSTYFRINSAGTGQFERTLIVAEEGSYVSYLEGCTAPMRDENQLHAAVVELIALDNAEIKYSTIQNWYPGDKDGKGGIYNFVTKRGLCAGVRSKISWTQVEAGSAVTWKYPSCILKGDYSTGELGKKAENAKNFSQCDSLLMGDKCGAHTFPYLEIDNDTAHIEHEATTSKVGEDQLYYCMQRGLNQEDAINLIVNGYCKDVFNELPMEFAVEAQKLLAVSKLELRIKILNKLKC